MHPGFTPSVHTLPQTLELQFAQGTTPDLERREQIGAQLGVSQRQIQVWFQNRRARGANPTYGKPKAPPNPNLVG